MDPKRWSGQAKGVVVIGGTVGLFTIGFGLCRSSPHVGWPVVVASAAYTVAFCVLVFAMLRDD